MLSRASSIVANTVEQAGQTTAAALQRNLMFVTEAGIRGADTGTAIGTAVKVGKLGVAAKVAVPVAVVGVCCLVGYAAFINRDVISDVRDFFSRSRSSSSSSSRSGSSRSSTRDSDTTRDSGVTRDSDDYNDSPFGGIGRNRDRDTAPPRDRDRDRNPPPSNNSASSPTLGRYTMTSPADAHGTEFLLLNADGTLSIFDDLIPPGTYTYSGNAITLYLYDFTVTGTFTASEVTFDVDGITFIFVKD
jgi:hypothetical protein